MHLEHLEHLVLLVVPEVLAPRFAGAAPARAAPPAGPRGAARLRVLRGWRECSCAVRCALPVRLAQVARYVLRERGVLPPLVFLAHRESDEGVGDAAHDVTRCRCDRLPLRQRGHEPGCRGLLGHGGEGALYVTLRRER